MGPGWPDVMAEQGAPFSDHADAASWRLRHVTDAMVALFRAQVAAQAKLAQRGGRR